MFLCRSRRKRRVSEKEKRKKSYHLASSWAWLRFSVVYPGETGALPANPYDTSRAQQNHEVDHRSNWPQENRKKKKKKRCLPGLENFTKACLFYVNPQRDFFCLKKKKGCSKYVAILCSQYCHGTLTALLLPDDIKTLITHFDQSDWEMTPDHIWWRMFHGMERRHLFFFLPNNKFINFLVRWSPASAVKCSWTLTDTDKLFCGTFKQTKGFQLQTSVQTGFLQVSFHMSQTRKL